MNNLADIIKIKLSKLKKYQNNHFFSIRDCFVKDLDGNYHNFLKKGLIKNQLDEGRKTLDSVEECIQYWYSYCASFVPIPWEILAKTYSSLHMYKQPLEIYDYASGQGQATIKLLDQFFYLKNKSSIRSINLIEPSKLALNISKYILKYHSPDIKQEKIYLVNKDINMLDHNDLRDNHETYKVHLFSYILDMGIINPKKLIEKILDIKGKHFIWAVSQNSNIEIMRQKNINQKTNRLNFDEFYEELDKQIILKPNVSKKSDIYQIDLLNTTIMNSSSQEKPILIFGRYIEVK